MGSDLTTPTHRPEVIIVGLGPAGRAVAHRCRARGLSVVAVDPHPDRTWTPTYAAWSDELPDWLPDGATAATVASVAVHTTGRRTLDRPYAVLDAAGLQRLLTLDGVTVLAGSAVQIGRTHVDLADGRKIQGATVIDARGLADQRNCPEQTAFGVVVDTATAAPILDGVSAWFMDWRNDNGAADTAIPSFLYAIPLNADEVLLEETCLVGRPALDPRELATRLHRRLAARGLGLTGTERIERVRFPVAAGPGARRSGATTFGARGAMTFGARGAMLHPGTGYSVAASLSAADPLATAIANGDNIDRALWPASARAIALLRTAGLRTLLHLDVDQVVPFFDAFFALPIPQQRAYLSDRTDAAGTAAAMGNLYRHLPANLRRAVTRSSLSVGKYSPIRRFSTIIER